MPSRKLLTLAATAVSICALLLTSACGDEPSPSPTGAGTLGGGGSVTPTPEATSTITFPTEPLPYAQAAIAAWAANDAETLDQYETADGLLHQLWDCAGCYNTAFSPAPAGCDGTAGSNYCHFFNTVGDELTIKVTNQFLGQPHAIGAGSLFDQTSFPSDNRAYAELAIAAWLNGNDARLKLLTAEHLTGASIDGLGAPRGTWTFDNVNGGAGSLFYEFRQGSHKLIIRFQNGPAAPTSGPDAQHRITGIQYIP